MNKRTVILSSNDNGDYLNYLPYTQKAWNLLGWNTLTFYLGDKEIESTEENKVVKIFPSSLYRNETMVQVHRLLASKFVKGLIMTGDVDMIPLANYWNPNADEITCYGYDLTGRKQYPICYIAMDAAKWDELIPEESIEELLAKYPNAKDTDFYKWWCVDQEIMTERLQAKQIISIERGFTNGLAQGRIDRNQWETTINNSDVKIDAHMVRPFNQEQAERIMKFVQI